MTDLKKPKIVNTKKLYICHSLQWYHYLFQFSRNPPKTTLSEPSRIVTKPRSGIFGWLYGQHESLHQAYKIAHQQHSFGIRKRIQGGNNIKLCEIIFYMCTKEKWLVRYSEDVCNGIGERTGPLARLILFFVM